MVKMHIQRGSDRIMKKRMDDKYKRDCVKQNSVKETIEDRWENCKIDKVSRGHGVEKAGEGNECELHWDSWPVSAGSGVWAEICCIIVKPQGLQLWPACQNIMTIVPHRTADRPERDSERVSAFWLIYQLRSYNYDLSLTFVI